jgi:hypothetical protein
MSSGRIVVRTRLLVVVVGMALLAASDGQAQTSTSTGGLNINSILQQLTGGGTGTGTGTGTTTTQPSTPGTPGTPAESDYPPALTTTLPQASVSLGSLQNRSPGRFVTHAQAVAAGEIVPSGTGDANDQPSVTSIARQTAFDITESVIQVVQQGILQLFSSFLSNLGINIAGGGSFVVPNTNINVTGTLNNQTTTSTGTVVPVP